LLAAAAAPAAQANVGLPVDPSAPLFAFIGRLEEQKGADILMAALPQIMQEAPNAQVGGGNKRGQAAVCAPTQFMAASAGLNEPLDLCQGMLRVCRRRAGAGVVAAAGTEAGTQGRMRVCLCMSTTTCLRCVQGALGWEHACADMFEFVLVTAWWQVIILGTGKAKFERDVRALDMAFPGKVKGVVQFSAPLAHLMTAGADYILVPSRFEPCGACTPPLCELSQHCVVGCPGAVTARPSLPVLTGTHNSQYICGLPALLQCEQCFDLAAACLNCTRV